jgi:hypothetical protein
MVPLQGVQRLLGPLGEDSDLRRWGQKLAGRGIRNGKKRHRRGGPQASDLTGILSGSAARHTSRCTTHARETSSVVQKRLDCATTERRVPLTAPVALPALLDF